MSCKPSQQKFMQNVLKTLIIFTCKYLRRFINTYYILMKNLKFCYRKMNLTLSRNIWISILKNSAEIILYSSICLFLFIMSYLIKIYSLYYFLLSYKEILKDSQNNAKQFNIIKLIDSFLMSYTYFQSYGMFILYNDQIKRPEYHNSNKEKSKKELS